VSILIPCYNAERYVGEAIESALGQTYPNVEVIVIDDGSTDGSLEVIRSFGERIRWETGPNRGGSAARNRGIELARGELVQFLDADDLLHPAKLERQVPLAESEPSTLVYCDYATEVVGPDGFVRNAPRYGGGDPVAFVLRKAGLQTSAPLHWKKHLLAAGGFRVELPCSQERDLHLRLACMGLSFRHMRETLYTVRRLGGSVSSDSTRVLDQHSGIAWNAYRLLESSGRLTDERRAALAGFLAADARAYLQHGLVEKARDYFRQAARLHPAGGIPQAYSGKTRFLYHLLGPVATQRLVGWKRSLAGRR
jgi:glycosyltransferase involved in cell wall biosynthesis